MSLGMVCTGFSKINFAMKNWFIAKMLLTSPYLYDIPALREKLHHFELHTPHCCHDILMSRCCNIRFLIDIFG